MSELWIFWFAAGLLLIGLVGVLLAASWRPADEENNRRMTMILGSAFLILAWLFSLKSGVDYGKLRGCGLPTSMNEKADVRLWGDTAYESIGEVVAGATHYSLVRQIDFIGGEYPLVCIKTTASVPKHFHIQDGKLVPISDR